MSKPLVLVSGPVQTRSGYGNHSRDLCRALIESDKYDVKINAVPWGNTPMNALEDDNKHHQEIKDRILPNMELSKQPDLHLHVVIPNEFQPIAKKNIGVTAGIESTIPAPQWIEGINRMDLTLCTSEFTKHVFASAERSEERRVGKECRSRWSPYH